MIDQNNATRIKLVKLWELLCQETDENHPMSTNTIIKKLADIGITVARKSLYRDIEILNQCGYEVLCNHSRANEYYVVDRQFNMPELHILMDAIQAAAFITPKKTKELVNKVASLGGSRAGETMKKNIVVFNNTKNTNEAIFFSVNEIVSAIQAHKKIEFRYFKYDINHNKLYSRDGDVYSCSPIATIFSDDKYYMFSYDSKHHGITHYRVDRMDEVTISEDEAEDLPEDLHFDVSEYKRSLFGMYHGDLEEVKIVLDKSLIDIVYDKFGDKVKMKPFEENKVVFTVNVQISPMFIGWACSFGEKMRIVSPASVVEQLKDYTQGLSALYLENGEK